MMEMFYILEHGCVAAVTLTVKIPGTVHFQEVLLYTDYIFINQNKH